jgi:transposase
MLRSRGRQGGFYDDDYICEQLIAQDSFYRKFREIVAPLIKEEKFESMYCTDNGRLAIPLSLLAMATILQFYKNLSDREMEQACMYDIQIKYALGLALDERPFDHSSLGDFRKRLLENGREKEIFDRILSHLMKQGLIEKNEIQRIDATHDIADIAVPTMVQLVKKTSSRFSSP